MAWFFRSREEKERSGYQVNKACSQRSRWTRLREPNTLRHNSSLVVYWPTKATTNDKDEHSIDKEAVDLPLSPAMENLYMENFEERALSSSPQQPKVFYRYVDNTFVTKPHGCHALDQFQLSTSTALTPTLNLLWITTNRQHRAVLSNLYKMKTTCHKHYLTFTLLANRTAMVGMKLTVLNKAEQP
ncbi:hypothetical protein J437_LFUL004211 [Ladona fulva]|uniref:Uncharacterized protein n=1 Tax=Ladona fulva TaxID=123851 RepID=A0A8K0JZ93_LADFU|nr:hypothetical protein J437_LFUL004211 [Ladona fulva]